MRSITWVHSGTASSDAPAQRVRCAEADITKGKKAERPLPGSAHGAFEPGERPAQVALAENTSPITNEDT